MFRKKYNIIRNESLWHIIQTLHIFHNLEVVVIGDENMSISSITVGKKSNNMTTLATNTANNMINDTLQMTKNIFALKIYMVELLFTVTQEEKLIVVMK